MRKTALNTIYELAKLDDRIVFIGSDLGAGVLDQFKQEMPDRFFMEGISEAHVIGMAAGMALEGRIVYINTIATFLTRRCFEQIVLDLCLHRANVRLIGSGGGVVYAPLGPTHEAIEDIAILRALPGMTVLAPADAQEMRRLITATVDHQGPVYIRLGKGGEPVVTDPDQPFEVGRVYPLREGADGLIVTTGVMAQMALGSSDLLAARGLKIGVLHVPSVKPMNSTQLLPFLEAVPLVLTLEEHTIMGGLGSSVAEILAESGLAKRFKRLGFPDVFPEKYGSQESLMAYYGLSSGLVAEALIELATLIK